MSNNNALVNLTPVEPTCGGICTKLSGPTPASYDTLESGDVAIFEWVFELSGNEDDFATFEGQLVNGYPGNTDSQTVTIKTIEQAELAGVSITSLGFGRSILIDNALLLHAETNGVPSGPPPPPTTIPNPIRNYELNGDATDEMGGTNLQLSDAGAGLTATGWDWAANDGATIVAGEVPETEYAIEIVFSFDDTDGWGRLLDYHNFQGSFNDADPENGIYIQTDDFDFWDGYGTTTTAALTDFGLMHVLIQRTASGTFEMYRDGALVLTFNDSTSEEAIFRGQPGNENLGQPAIFFKDNGGEESAGFVDCIRVFDQAMSSADAITVTTDSSTCYDFAIVSEGPFQLSPSGAELGGVVLVFDSVDDSYQWFSANASGSDITIDAGNWNASLRYNSDRLPSGMAAGASIIYDTSVNGVLVPKVHVLVQLTAEH
jgi:hypothetical protein